MVPVIASNARCNLSVFPLIWGFRQAEREHTKRMQPLINARSETAGAKPTFRECWQRRRCIIPASWYYEWDHLIRPDGGKKAGSKYAIQPAAATTTWMAGLYRTENGFPFFTILTREPSGELLKIHDRMPLILPESLIAAWVDPSTSAADVNKIASSALTDMIMERV